MENVGYKSQTAMAWRLSLGVKTPTGLRSLGVKRTSEIKIWKNVEKWSQNTAVYPVVIVNI